MMSAGMFSTKRVVLTKRAAAPAIITRRQNSRCRSRSPLTANMVERTISPPESQSAMSGTSPDGHRRHPAVEPLLAGEKPGILEDGQLEYLSDGDGMTDGNDITAFGHWYKAADV